VKADKISLQMKSVESPVQFTLKSDEHFIYIVMPIRNF
jgi:DNA polymerase III sliding clamp (beta) subunit (PCNA family)